MWEYYILEQIEASKWKQRAGWKSRTEVSRIKLHSAELGARRQAMSKVTGKVFPSQNSIPIQTISPVQRERTPSFPFRVSDVYPAKTAE